MILRHLGDSIAFCPPLIINEAEIDLMFERFALALDDTFAMVRERGLVADRAGSQRWLSKSPVRCQKVGGVLIQRIIVSVFPGFHQRCCVLLVK